MRMKALAAVVFVVLQALAAAALFLLSVHGPSGLVYGAPVYLVLAAAVTWWASRKGWVPLLVAGAACLAAAPGLFWTLKQAERIAYERRLAATQISDVRDEPILRAGTPVGVRFTFSAAVPARGHFGIIPTLYPRDERVRQLQLVSLRWRFDGRPGPPDFGPFDPGRKHQLEFELYPSILSIDREGAHCRNPIAPPQLPATASGLLLADISDSPYGAPWRGGREEPTRNTYDVAAMYRAVLDLPTCKVPGQ